MSIKSICAKLALLFCLVALAAAAAGPARANESQYACKCKGSKQWVLFVPYYGGPCGDGYIGSENGKTHKYLTEEGLLHLYAARHRRQGDQRKRVRLLPRVGLELRQDDGRHRSLVPE